MYVNIFFSSFSVEFQHFLGYPIIKVNMYTFLDFFYIKFAAELLPSTLQAQVTSQVHSLCQKRYCNEMPNWSDDI